MLMALGLTSTFAQSGGGGGSTPVVPRAVLPWDPMAYTNRAALFSLAVLHIENIVVRIRHAGDTQLGNDYDNNQTFVMPVTDSVKSFQSMLDMVQGSTFVLNTVDPTKPAWVSVMFYQGTPPSNGYYGDNGTYQALLAGNNQNGKLVMNQFGAYVLDQESARVTYGLNYSIRVSLPGLIDGKAIMDSESDYPYTRNLNVDSSTGEFTLPVEAVGTGALVLYGKFDGQYQTVAISLVSGQQVSIKDVWIRVLLQDSQEVYSFVNPQEIRVRIASWNGYGINPLLIVKNTVVQSQSLDVSTTEGQIPRGYWFRNIATGVTPYVSVLEGATSIQVNLGLGEFHIIPDIDLKGGGGGGKGGYMTTVTAPVGGYGY